MSTLGLGVGCIPHKKQRVSKLVKTQCRPWCYCDPKEPLAWPLTSSVQHIMSARQPWYWFVPSLARAARQRGKKGPNLHEIGSQFLEWATQPPMVPSGPLPRSPVGSDRLAFSIQAVNYRLPAKSAPPRSRRRGSSIRVLRTDMCMVASTRTGTGCRDGDGLLGRQGQGCVCLGPKCQAKDSHLLTLEAMDGSMIHDLDQGSGRHFA